MIHIPRKPGLDFFFNCAESADTFQRHDQKSFHKNSPRFQGLIRVDNKGALASFPQPWNFYSDFHPFLLLCVEILHLINLDTQQTSSAQVIRTSYRRYQWTSPSFSVWVPAEWRLCLSLPGHETLASERINGQDNNEACPLLSPAARGRLSVTEMFSHPDFMHEVYWRGRQAAVHRWP